MKGWFLLQHWWRREAGQRCDQKLPIIKQSIRQVALRSKSSLLGWVWSVLQYLGKAIFKYEYEQPPYEYWMEQINCRNKYRHTTWRKITKEYCDGITIRLVEGKLEFLTPDVRMATDREFNLYSSDELPARFPVSTRLWRRRMMKIWFTLRQWSLIWNEKEENYTSLKAHYPLVEGKSWTLCMA